MMKVKQAVCKAFNRQAFSYEQAALVQKEIGQRLFARLAYLKIKPEWVLDLGCGTGFFSQALQNYYPQAKIVSLDLAYLMLKETKKKQGFWRKWSLVNADMTELPFKAASFDLVFANQVLHWGPRDTLLAELNRVMTKDACLMFSTLGPDTFKELKLAWQQQDNYAHSNEFADMHDLGDALLSHHFANPIVDMEWLTLHYQSLEKLIRGLKEQGIPNINKARKQGLTSKKAWQGFSEAYQGFCTPAGKYPLTYEVVYGHAWKGEEKKQTNGHETFIPLSKIQGLSKA